jgi:cell division septal protein FtsQ
MATDKRDRQRQNREAKKVEEEKAAKKRRRISLIKRYAIYVVIFGASIVILYFLTS